MISSSLIRIAHMTPILQRTGTDCVRCCLSTILDLPYERVPCFGHMIGEERWKAILSFLESIGGYTLIPFDYDVTDDKFVNFYHIVVERCDFFNKKKSFLDFFKKKTRSVSDHAVVYLGNTLQFDPGALDKDWRNHAYPIYRWLIVKTP